jgi:DNA-binding transcriptional LysR family regulator
MKGAFDLLQLRYFRAVARAGSLTAAARQHRVSQPTLSVSLRQLEAALGAVLFHRGREGVRLTDAGEELLSHAERLLAGAERAEQAVRGLAEEDVGRFVIGCPDVLGAYFLPPLLSRLFQKAPRLEISIWSGTSREVERAVLEREVHFGLVARAFPYPELVRVDLFQDVTELVVLAPTPRGRERARERLRRGPLIFVESPQGGGASQELFRGLVQEGLLPEKRLPCGTLELVKSVALAGVGVAFLPRRVAEYGHPGRLKTLHPGLPAVPDTISLIYRGDLQRTRAALRLKSELTAHGQEL